MSPARSSSCAATTPPTSPAPRSSSMAASTSIEGVEAARRRRRIEEKRARLEALRPWAGRSLAALAKWYDVEPTWSSNAIEGNTLSRSETAIILEMGRTIGGKPLKDHLEAIGHSDALAYVRALAAEARPIRETDIREIHRLVLRRVAPGRPAA